MGSQPVRDLKPSWKRTGAASGWRRTWTTRRLRLLRFSSARASVSLKRADRRLSGPPTVGRGDSEIEEEAAEMGGWADSDEAEEAGGSGGEASGAGLRRRQGGRMRRPVSEPVGMADECRGGLERNIGTEGCGA